MLGWRPEFRVSEAWRVAVVNGRRVTVARVELGVFEHGNGGGVVNSSCCWSIHEMEISQEEPRRSQGGRGEEEEETAVMLVGAWRWSARGRI
ncbi:proline-rich receptor-like protein kinase PERK2 [Iris pallida]|uniref:Proline-rich receptor-like protein kinase PERK2 n=1 Tax=Iris pallida TaxID=29817 RepID=A0AAX6FGU6_IRIPA|nr:proline-rich receptor-like protein kinase PERK2 [Iris pallida]